jgi:hypothetical protein
MYLATPTSIDFIAHHEIQFQSVKAIFEKLSKIHECRVLIGQDCSPSGAEVGIMLDHGYFQKKVSKKNYSFLIHMSHDLADFEIYKEEKEYLKNYDLILTPGLFHSAAARKIFKKIPIIEIGWPKLEIPVELKHALKSPPFTIIYAPTFIENREWENLLPALINTNGNIIIKNHLYYDFESGAEPPRGCEALYALSISSLKDMEEFLSAGNYQNVEYIDRRTNLCHLFPRADLLVTDTSSASLEFLNFGISIETGRFGPEISNTKASASLLTNRVKYLPEKLLISTLRSSIELNKLIVDAKIHQVQPENPMIFSPTHGASLFASSVIDYHLWEFEMSKKKSNKLLNRFF